MCRFVITGDKSSNGYTNNMFISFENYIFNKQPIFDSLFKLL